MVVKCSIFQTPNILGFTFGIVQMVLYIVYKDGKKSVLPEFKQADFSNGDHELNKEKIIKELSIGGEQICRENIESNSEAVGDESIIV